MNKKRLFRVMSTVLCGVISFSTVATLGSCGQKKKDSITIMTEELSGLFNPFYATSGTDMDVVGMTQIGMLSTDRNGNLVAGDTEPTVVKDFEYHIEGTGEEAKTIYTFVLKNNLKFSDGHPLTMEDVLFNMYEYLDPVYTGSSTMYSIDIEGLSQYRTQTNYASGSESADAQIAQNANAYARLRILELRNIFEQIGKEKYGSTTQTFKATSEEMKAAIDKHNVSDGYKRAVASKQEQADLAAKGADEEAAFYRAQLWADYQETLTTFKKELQADFKAAKESYDLTTAPYSDHAEALSSDIFKFFLYEGYITPVYAKLPNANRDDKTKILKFENTQVAQGKTEEQAIEYVYKQKIEDELHQILSYWGTAGTLTTKYSAESIDIQLHDNMKDGELAYPNVSGIVSLGHTTDTKTVKIGEKTYNVASDLDENGVPKNSNEYEVLQITVKGTDPKAIYSFGFSVAPAHYYSADEDHPNGREIDIKNNKFGVEWASSEFQSNTIQSAQHLEVPMGAGAFQATNKDNATNPKGSEFWSQNIVYFKRNDNFEFPVKAEKLRFQVVSASNALDKLENGEVDYITPQFTKANSARLAELEKKGFTQLSSWQLGYGYIGINAGKVPNVNVRRAIMAAMQTSLALEYYETGTCKVIDWPMSTVSWAYPYQADGTTSKPNGQDYMMWKQGDEKNGYASAKAEIQKYMNAANVKEGDSALKIKFTIAGASITEHPTYAVFKQAAEILNSMGWEVEVKADSQALTKLSTGSLEVWAAAWGAALDPDMYQVYHKNSTATSVYAWGYREIKADTTTYKYENDQINALSEIIDEARSMMDQDARKPLYESAMRIVLDLAIEMPVYQRMTLYAYNNKTLQGLNNTVNPYTSPLEKIWDLELTDAAKAGTAGGSSVVVIVIVAVVGAAALAAGGFFGYKFLMKKKASGMNEYEEDEDETEENNTEVEETSEETEVEEASEETEE